MRADRAAGGYLHALTGLAYEFHVFFVLPVLVVSWFNGMRLADRRNASRSAAGIAHGAPFTAVFIGLDRFKEVNDALMYEVKRSERDHFLLRSH